MQRPCATAPEDAQNQTQEAKSLSLFTQQSLLKDVDPASVRHVLARCLERDLAAGDVLLHRGVVNDELYLILSGKVSVHLESFDDPPLTTLGAGECVGELSVFDGMPPSADVKSMEPTRLLVIPRAILWELVNASPVVARNLLYELAHRMRSSNATLSETRHAKNCFEQAAKHDALTGLTNRRGLEAALNTLTNQKRPDDFPLSLAMLDVDHFKQFNDTYGHQAGDMVLSALAALFQRHIRARDLVARYGGEEFILVLPSTALHQAVRVVERLRRLAASHRIQFEGRDLPQVTFSAGLSEWSEGESIEQAIETADAALYRAKQAGRNCICKAESTP